MNSFIWTEALGVAEILPPFLKSYVKHNSFPINVIIYDYELENLPQDPLIIPVLLREGAASDFGLPSISEMQRLYSNGHAGTARLWAEIIANTDHNLLIHFDGDIICLGDIVSPIVEKLTKGYAITGIRRANRYGVSGCTLRNFFISIYRDTVHTMAFGFRADKCRNISQNKLVHLLQSKQRFPPALDFFDSLFRKVWRKGGVYYLGSPKQISHGILNEESSYQNLIFSFSAIGSGCNFYKNGFKNDIKHYAVLAIESFKVFSNIFLGKSLVFEDNERTRAMIRSASKIDQEKWKFHHGIS